MLVTSIFSFSHNVFCSSQKEFLFICYIYFLSANAFNLVQSLNFTFGRVSTRSQTTNFKLFQTDRVCRRRFQICQKVQKVLHTGKKHCRKRRNCSYRAISPVPTGFSKDLYCRHVKPGLVWERVKFRKELLYRLVKSFT